MFITHDLATVRAIADEVVVMKEGLVVEAGPKLEVFQPAPTTPTPSFCCHRCPRWIPDWLTHSAGRNVTPAALAQMWNRQGTDAARRSPQGMSAATGNGPGGHRMSDFVALLGVKGGPAIRPGSNMPTSTLLSFAEKTILVDAGLGAARGVCDQGVALTAIDAILVTHLHSDHYLELGPPPPHRMDRGPEPAHPRLRPAAARPVLAGVPDLDGGRHCAQDRGLRAARDFARSRGLRAIPENGPIDLAGITVHALENEHPPVRPSYAFRFESGDKRIVLSGDTAPIRPWRVSPGAPICWSTRRC